MRYVEARIDKYQREEAYRIYTTRSLQLMPQSKWIEMTYLDALKPHEKEKSGDEILLDTMINAGLRFEE